MMYETDPYPHKLPDSFLWLKLFQLALNEDDYMAGILHWYRATGAVLEPNDKFGYIIKPLFLGRDGCEWGWADEEEWQKEKQHLLPYWEKVAKILKELREEIDKNVF